MCAMLQNHPHNTFTYFLYHKRLFKAVALRYKCLLTTNLLLSTSLVWRISLVYTFLFWCGSITTPTWSRWNPHNEKTKGSDFF